MTYFKTCLAGGLLFVATLGCNSVRETGRKVTPPDPDAKATLEEIASSGSLSKKNLLRSQLESMSEAKPEVAGALLSDYQQLVRQSSPEAVKSKAREMAEKL